MAVNVVADLFALVAEHAIRFAGRGAFHQVGKEAVKLRAGVRGASETTAAEAHCLHAEVPPVFLDQNVRSEFRRAEERVLGLVDAHCLGNTRLKFMARGDFPTLLQFDQRQPIGTVSINFIGRGENERRFGTESTGRLKQVQRPVGVDREIHLRIACGPVVRGLRRGMHHEHNVSAQSLEQVGHGRLVANVEVAMFVAGDCGEESLAMRRGGGFVPKEPFAQVVVDANNLETFTGKADDAFRADQAGGPRHNNGIHCFFFFTRFTN